MDQAGVFNDWLVRCRQDPQVSRGQLPDGRSKLPEMLIAAVGGREFDENELARSAQNLAGTVDNALRQLFLLGQVLLDVSETDVQRLMHSLGKAAEAIALERVGVARKEALTDPLTGVPSRGGFQIDLDGALKRVRQAGGTFSLAMLDLDGLKVVNDESGLGHSAGDSYLRIFCGMTQDFVRSSRGRVFRYGGDEFCVLFRDVERSQAEALLRELQEQSDIPPFCYGVAGCPDESLDGSHLLAIADEERLYEMKEEIGSEARAAKARAWLTSNQSSLRSFGSVQ